MGGDDRDEGVVREARSVDEKLAPHDFVADFVWAGREVLRKPSVALVSILIWSAPGFLTTAIRASRNPIALAVSAVVVLGLWYFGTGWLGAERTFFRLRLEGKDVTLRELLRVAPDFIVRFFVAGLLAGLAALPVLGVSMFVSAALAASGKTALALAVTRGTLILVMVAGDLAFTFVTPALAFTTPSVREALRIGLRMIRQTWPRSGLYVLCPPLALNMLNVMFPIRLPLVTLVSTAAFAVLALVAKGATAAFYLREHPIVSNDRSVVAGVE